MPGLFQSITSAIRCISKSNDRDPLSIGTSAVISNSVGITEVQVPKKRLKSHCCVVCDENCENILKQHKEIRSCKRFQTQRLGMNDQENNNFPGLRSKEMHKSGKVERGCGCYGKPPARRARSSGKNSPDAHSRYPGNPNFLKLEFSSKADQSGFSKFNRHPNNPHRVEVSKFSSSTLPMVYSTPRVIKHPHHSSFRETSSRSFVDTSGVHPPPNRTIFKNNEQKVVGVAPPHPPKQRVAQNTGEKSNCTEDYKDTIAISGWSANSISSDPSHHPQSLHDDVSLPPSYPGGPPPEYSEPPDYYAVL